MVCRSAREDAALRGQGRSMQPLTVDDLIPLEEFAGRRREFFDAHRRYVDRYRRVRIGPRLTLIFENRQTLWFRVQEVLRIARLAEPEQVQQELDLYNRLLPGRDCLQAALLIEIVDPGNLAKELSGWKDLQGTHLQLRIGEESLGAFLVTCRPEDRCVGTSHWVQFHFDGRARRLLADPQLPALFRFDDGSYRYDSPVLSEEFRQSLLEDLQMSERDRVVQAA